MQPPLLQYPLKSHRKSVKLPPESKELAELLGIITGDGGIGNKWQLIISLNSEKDIDYALYVKNLIENLFGISVRQSRRPNQHTTILVSTSTTLVDFIIGKGAIRGNKITGNISIPTWIKSNTEYVKAFIRGVVDTDGCLYIHNHKVAGKNYSNIGFCFTSYATTLLLSIADVFRSFGFNPHITYQNRRIYFYGEKDVIKYLNVFGSSNPRIYQMYEHWRDARVV